MPTAQLVDRDTASSPQPQEPPRAADLTPEARIHPKGYKQLYLNTPALNHLGRPAGLRVQAISSDTFLLMAGDEYPLRYTAPERKGPATASMARLFKHGAFEQSDRVQVFRLSRGNGALYLHPGKPLDPEAINAEAEPALPKAEPIKLADHAKDHTADDVTAAWHKRGFVEKATPATLATSVGATLPEQAALAQGAVAGNAVVAPPAVAAEEEPVYMAIGARVRRLRERRGWTQEQLAEAAGMTRTSITNLEAGRQRVPLHTLGDVATALEVTVTDLFSDRPAVDTAVTENVCDLFERAAVLLRCEATLLLPPSAQQQMRDAWGALAKQWELFAMTALQVEEFRKVSGEAHRSGATFGRSLSEAGAGT